MALSVAMTGSGTVGPVADGWSVAEQVTPTSLGDTSGSIGVAAFDAGLRSDSRYVQDNPVVLTHDVAGSFRGYVQSASVDPVKVSATVSGGLGFLVADKTMPSVGLDNNYDHQAVVYGSGTGQVSQAYAVVVDPFDGSFFVTSVGSVNGVDRTRVIKLSSAGVYISEFGSAGTGNGQFGATVLSVAVSPVDGSVYVSDAGNSRVQRFTTADRITYTYSTQWGTAGSGHSQFNSTSFTYPVAVDASGNVFVGDRSTTRIQKFSSTGTWSAQISTGGTSNLDPYDIQVDSAGNVYASMPHLLDGTSGGRIDKFPNTLASLTSSLLLPEPGSIAAAIDDGIGNFVIDTDGSIWAHWIGTTYLVKYDSSGNELFRWQSSYPVPVDANTNYDIGINATGGIVVLFRVNLPQTAPYGGYYVTTFAATAVTLSTTFQRYMQACDSALNGYTFSFTAASNPNVVIPAWTGDVWTKLKEMCVVYNVELALVGTVITVRDVGVTALAIDNHTPVTTSPSNVFTGREIDITYQNPVAGGGVMYDSATAGDIWSIDVGQSTARTITTTNYPTTLAQPTPTDVLPIQPGQYYVVDSAGLPVLAATWLAAGGQVLVTPDPSPGVINFQFVGPTNAIPGFTGPFYFANNRATTAAGQLSVAGNGVRTTPQVLQLLTGADTSRTGQQVAFTINSPFVDTLTRAYDRGVWASDEVAGAQVEIQFSIGLNKLGGYGLTTGTMVTFEGSRYRVTDVTFDNKSAQIKARRRVTLGEVDTAWSGQALSVSDTFWSGYSFGDRNIQPLAITR